MCWDVLDAGINVITAVNIQHIESINEDVRRITGVDVKERVPDRMPQWADDVVNINLTTDELINRLKEGKIYVPRIGLKLSDRLGLRLLVSSGCLL